MRLLIAIALSVASSCTSIAGSTPPPANVPSNVLRTSEATTPRSTASAAAAAAAGEGSDPLRCTARLAIAPVPDVFEAAWAPDSRRVAISHIVLRPYPDNVTGTDEDQRLAVWDVVSGALRELGQGSEPRWSASGRLLAFWNADDMDLRIARDGEVIARFRPTQPDVRWVGEELYYWNDSEIRVWTEDGTRPVSSVTDGPTLKYPLDDAYFSADGTMFTITRYAPDRSERRLLGVTATGETTPVGAADTRFVEWSPLGHTLLLRSPDRLAVRYDDGHTRTVSSTELPGPVHGWTADGELLLGSLSPTVPSGNAYDTFTVWGEGARTGAKASLPNLFGIRAFSPDGAYFSGTSRTGVRSTQLEVYRCGAAWSTDLATDPSVKARAEAIAKSPLRFIRPTSGAYTNYVQRGHTGIDVAAPYGSLVYAGDDGVVTGVGMHQYGGHYVCVTHPNRVELCDYHISLALVRAGERVVRGQPVALIGMSGITTGPHVHWEAKLDGEIVDPLKY